jgi:Vitamin K-dependent gamma-carboxylase
MNGLSRLVASYFKQTAESVAADWNSFWHSAADPTLLGLIRIMTGLMLLYTHAVWGLALGDFFSSTAWLTPSLVRNIQASPYACSFWFLVPDGWIWPVYVVTMVIFALFAAGLFTRVTSILAFLTAVSYANRVQPALFGLDQINVMLTLYLAIGPSGAAFSFDRWLAQRRGGPSALAASSAANLAIRLIQVHMCVIYFFAGISKLQGPAWWSGEAMWLAFANLEYQSLDMTWLASHPWLVNAMSQVSVLWEISFCVLVWQKRWRPLVLAVAVVLHVGIGACLGMWTFGLIMLVGCASFLPSDLFRKTPVQASRPRHRSRESREKALGGSYSSR